MIRRTLVASLGIVLTLSIACGNEEEDLRKRPATSFPQDSGDATGQSSDGGTSPAPDSQVPDNASNLPNKPSQLNWDGTEPRGDSDFNVIPTE